MKNIREIYAAYQSGDSLTNKEVELGVLFFDDLSKKLNQCGPEFKLAFAEATRVYFALEGFQKAREK